jgi:putative acetyltransferase
MQKPEPILRPVNAADAVTVQALVFGVLRSYGLEPDPADTDADLADPVTFYRSGWFRVLELNNTIIGTVGLMPMEGNVWELRKMYLASNHRGNGLGRQMLAAALAEARALGACKIVLGTATVLKEAIGLYCSEGFVPSTEAHPAARCDQTWELILHERATNN